MKTLGFIGLLFLLVGCGQGLTYIDSPYEKEDLKSWLGDYTTDKVKSNSLKGGLSIGVYSSGEVLFTQGQGYANRDNGSLVTADTAMPVGSISKVITAVGIMQLIEIGHFTLDDTIAALIPDLKLPDGAEKEITVQMLLTHRSGIQGDILKDFFTWDDVNPEEFQREIIGYLNSRPLINDIGKMFSYSNASYALLGIIIENVSGDSYTSYITKNIFNKAGMNNSFVNPFQKGADNVLGYGKGKAIPAPLVRDMAAGAIMISSNDMMKFVDSLYNGILISEDTFKLMTTVQNSGNEYDRAFTMGLTLWLINPLGTEDVIAAHGGDLPPFHSIIVMFPQRKSAIFVSTNDDALKGALAVTTGLDLSKALIQFEEQKPFDELVTNPMKANGYKGDLETFVGSYSTLAGTLDVKYKKERLSVVFNGLTLPIKMNENGWWKIDFINIGGIDQLSLDLFEVDGVQYMGLWSSGVFAGAFSKIEEVTYPKEFRKWVGKYIDPDSDIKDFLLVKDQKNQYTITKDLFGTKLELFIDPIAKNKAHIPGIGRFVGDDIIFSETSEAYVATWSGIDFYRYK